MAPNKPYAPYVIGKFSKAVNETQPDIGSLVFSGRKKIRAVKPINRSLNVLKKESRQFAPVVFAHQHRRYLVPVFHQQIPQRKSLCQVPASFSLNDKDKFHATKIHLFPNRAKKTGKTPAGKRNYSLRSERRSLRVPNLLVID
jgi:hypothetical protein